MRDIKKKNRQAYQLFVFSFKLHLLLIPCLKSVCVVVSSYNYSEGLEYKLIFAKIIKYKQKSQAKSFLF